MARTCFGPARLCKRLCKRDGVSGATLRRAVTGGYDGIPRVWDLLKQDRASSRDLEGHEGPVRSVAISRDGAGVLSGGRDRAVRLWNAETGEMLRALEGHRGTITAVAFLPDGVPFGAIHGMPWSAATPMDYTPNVFTYGSGLETIANWQSLASASCGAISNVTMLSNCTNHSGASQSYTRSYGRSYRAP